MACLLLLLPIGIALLWWFTNELPYLQSRTPSALYRYLRSRVLAWVLCRFLGEKLTPPADIDILDRPLVHLSPVDPFTFRHACEHVAIFGSVGSMKTTGSARTFALSYLDAGMAAVVLCAKVSETERWVKYARQTGREKDVILFRPDMPYRLNFIDYEMNRSGAGSGLLINLVAMFTSLAEMADRHGQGAGQKDKFWDRAMEQMLTAALCILQNASDRVSLADVHELIVSAPTSAEMLQSAKWQEQSACFQAILKGEERNRQGQLGPRARDFERSVRYFLDEFPQLAEKTRSIVVNTFTNVAAKLLQHPFYDLFCTDTNITPERCWEEGKILILSLPLKEYGAAGLLAQGLMKMVFQTALERRAVNKDSRGVLFFADESHLFLTGRQEYQFLTTARESRGCCIYISQSVSNYLAAHGDHAKAEADAFLGVFGTIIFHQLSDPASAKWASELVASDYTWLRSTNTGGGDSYQPGGYSQNTSGGVGRSEQVQPQLLPVEFTRLKKPSGDGVAEAIVVRGGQQFRASGRNYLKVPFHQFD
jgi:type IV secretory pathway TraG/TraD family ATPase VirD4